MCGPAVRLCRLMSPFPRAVAGDRGNPSFYECDLNPSPPSGGEGRVRGFSDPLYIQWSRLGCGTGRNAFRDASYARGFPAKHLFVVRTGSALPTVINGQMRWAPPGRIQSDCGDLSACLVESPRTDRPGEAPRGIGGPQSCVPPDFAVVARPDSCLPALNNSIPAPRRTAVKPVPLQNTSPEAKR